MKNFMKIFLSSLLIVPNLSCAAIVHAKIVGNNIDWSNATTNGEEIAEINWHSAERFNMRPVSEFVPGFVAGEKETITFRNTVRKFEFETKFKINRINFKAINANDKELEDNSVGPICSNSDSNGLVISLSDNKNCLSSQKVSFIGEAREPFKFYNVGFLLPELVSDLKDKSAPDGQYTATFNYNVGYGSKLPNDIVTYNIYPSPTTTIIIDYKESFISSVDVIGSGEFDLDYNTESHTVKGALEYNVHVSGAIEPGIKMTFSSSDISDEFYLEKDKWSTKIPYNITCDVCKYKNIVENGAFSRSEEEAVIDFSGSDLNYKLKFDFDEQAIIDAYPSGIEAGKYLDTVTVLFELNI